MRRIELLRIFALIAMTSLVLAFLGLGLIRHDSASTCPLAASMGSNCVKATNHKDMALHHLTSLKQMSTATLTWGLMIVAFMAVFFTASLSLSSKILLFQMPRSWCFRKRERFRHKTSSHTRYTLFWSALHNKYGTITLSWMREFPAIRQLSPKF